MKSTLSLYNTLSRRKERFEPLEPPFVGLYVCGPTVYGDPHLGHARPAVTFDLLFRYLKATGYKVRYVRNITDVGHLEHDADEGEDKIAKKARLEQLEPMEVAQYYTDRYHDAMRALNVLPPSIEPPRFGPYHRADRDDEGHSREGLRLCEQRFGLFRRRGLRPQVPLWQVVGPQTTRCRYNTRTPDGQGDKRGPFDFALWKKASKAYIICAGRLRGATDSRLAYGGSAMSTRYLGETSDIHGGGMHLLSPKHYGSIAQSRAAGAHDSARYWMHNNMITINGQKMGKSLGNFITLEELTTGRHKLLEQAYSPMTIRFFILQAHYRGTLDFSNEALQAAEKGYERLMKAVATLPKLKPSAVSTVDVSDVERRCVAAMDDDLNTPVVISVLFDCVRTINQIYDGHRTISEADLKELARVVRLFVFDIVGLRDDLAGDNSQMLASVVDMVLDIRQQAKAAKDWATSDRIRDGLASVGIRVKDRKDGYDWETE